MNPPLLFWGVVKRFNSPALHLISIFFNLLIWGFKTPYFSFFHLFFLSGRYLGRLSNKNGSWGCAAYIRSICVDKKPLEFSLGIFAFFP